LSTTTRTAAPLGRRESNKRDKLARIRAAASEVFQSKGFDDASVREIAERAGVALGTLFLYADDKRDLLMLLYDEDLGPLTDRAFARADPGADFIDQLISFFGEFFRSFTPTPELTRQMLREVLFANGKVAKRLAAGMQQAEDRVAEIVARAQHRGLVAREVPPATAAQAIFSLFRTEIRLCLADRKLDTSRSLTELRGQYEVLINGLKPSSRHTGSG
jgi:AcrR family transcriptional regulator